MHETQITRNEFFPYRFAQLSELGFSLILGAKQERLLGHFLVQVLNLVIVLEQVKAVLVRFPDELKPGCEQVSVGAVLRGLAAYRFEKQTLGRVYVLQIVHIGEHIGRVARSLLGLLGTLLSRLQKAVDYLFQRLDVIHLTHCLVLMQTVFGHVALLEFDAQVEEALYDLLVRLGPCAILLVTDHLVQGV